MTTSPSSYLHHHHHHHHHPCHHHHRLSFEMPYGHLASALACTDFRMVAIGNSGRTQWDFALALRLAQSVLGPGTAQTVAAVAGGDIAADPR
eukprot:2904076-Rhodomonas_salina.1